MPTVTPTGVRLNVRWIIHRDLPEAAEIARLSGVRPADGESIRAAVRPRNCIAHVAYDLDADRVAGWMLYEVHARRLALVALAVHPDYRRRGVGSALLAKLLDKCGAARRPACCAFVPDDALPAHLLFRSAGWRCQFVSRGHYPGGRDAYLFERRV